ncbi:MAG TPA: hypothetical protein VM686_39555 [Polyangiaceae bacterium]|nr:hypothetical protein [Polyangiaceae bacterium]
MRRTVRFALMLCAAFGATTFGATTAHAQSWIGPRTTPSTRELIAVDRTGEDGWPFGTEDVAADGLGTFGAAEQSVDLRSAYAATDTMRFWLRAYVSSTGEPDVSLRLFVFIDSDDDDATGGSAEATDIDPDLGPDPTVGGYDHVVGLGGDGSVLGVWSYAAAQNAFADTPASTANAMAEVGVDRDPLRFGSPDRGYLQGSVELGDVELTASCTGNLFLRALSDEGNDSDVGARVACVPADANNNGVPNVVEQVTECNVTADCPAGAVCVAGTCRFTPACNDDTDCAAGESCVDGLCVADGGQNCSDSVDCNGLVCVNGTCEACGSGVSCASGQTCAADGRCVAGTAGGGEGGAAALVDPDEEVQGGACTCRLGRRSSPLGWTLALGLAALALGRRRYR